MKKVKIPKCHPDRAFYCKDLCRRCYEKQLREANPEYWERQLQNCRNWHNSHKEHVAKRNKEYRKENPLSREEKRKRFLKNKYNITLEQFNKILLYQNNKCYICEFPLKDGDVFLHIDHCHNTGKIRGILCSQCNWFMSKVDKIKNCMKNLKNYVKNQGSLWEKQEDIIKEKLGMN